MVRLRGGSNSICLIDGLGYPALRGCALSRLSEDLRGAISFRPPAPASTQSCGPTVRWRRGSCAAVDLQRAVLHGVIAAGVVALICGLPGDSESVGNLLPGLACLAGSFCQFDLPA